VLFSLGNLVANQGAKRPATYDGAIATVTFTRDADGRFRTGVPTIEPTWYDHRSAQVRLVLPSLADPALGRLKGSLEASLARTTAVLGPFVRSS
jgi:hypothetical protein